MEQTKSNTITDVHAVSFFNSARKFHEAANQLFDLQKPSLSDPCDPINFLYFHTVELALKAFLRSKNVSILGTERQSHKLTELYEECRSSLGLTVGPADRFEIGNIVTLLEKGNKYQGFRYPNLESGVLADLSWTREVVEQLMRTVEPHVEACSKRDGTPGPPVGFRVTMTFGKPIIANLDSPASRQAGALDHGAGTAPLATSGEGMKTLQELLMVFHDSANCPGIITTDEAGRFVCAECGRRVGQLDPKVLKTHSGSA